MLRRVVCGTALVGGLIATAARGQATDSIEHPAAHGRFWIRPLASLLLPGSGQLIAHQDRGAIYLATELLLLTRFLQLNHDGNVGSRRFRDLAFQVARRPYGPIQRDTVFEYFETMERFTASGQFDGDPGLGFAPETDPSTYNGSVWLLARRTFWVDPNVPPPPTSPEYQRALAFYTARAVGPSFLWSWQDASLEQQEFRATIHSSDDAFRQAQNQLGLLLANHVASAVDALISSRLAAVARRTVEFHSHWSRRGAAVSVRVAF